MVRNKPSVPIEPCKVIYPSKDGHYGFCSGCQSPREPDYFGYIFELCSNCVADRWFYELTKSARKKR